jgi:hypothetical protein
MLYPSMPRKVGGLHQSSTPLDTPGRTPILVTKIESDPESSSLSQEQEDEFRV